MSPDTSQEENLPQVTISAYDRLIYGGGVPIQPIFNPSQQFKLHSEALFSMSVYDIYRGVVKNNVWFTTINVSINITTVHSFIEE